MTPRVPDQDLGGGNVGLTVHFRWLFLFFEADTHADSSKSSLLLLPPHKKKKEKKKKYKDGDHENEDV